MITWKELVKGATLTGSAVSQYTTPAGTYTTVHACSANNPTGGVVTVNLYKVTSGGSAGNSTLIVSRAVPAGKTAQFPELVNHKMEPGGFISASGNGAFLTISGAENVPE